MNKRRRKIEGKMEDPRSRELIGRRSEELREGREGKGRRGEKSQERKREIETADAHWG